MTVSVSASRRSLNTSPVSPSNAHAVVERACTSRPTDVRSENIGASQKMRSFWNDAHREATHVNSPGATILLSTTAGLVDRPKPTVTPYGLQLDGRGRSSGDRKAMASAG